MSAAVERKVPRTYRLDRGLDAALKARAAVEGRLESEVVRDALRAYCGAGASGEPSAAVGEVPQPAASSSVAAVPRAPEAAVEGEGLPAPLVGVAGWLSGRLGLPESVCRAKVALGAVLVGGEPAGLDADLGVLEAGPVVVDGCEL